MFPLIQFPLSPAEERRVRAQAEALFHDKLQRLDLDKAMAYASHFFDSRENEENYFHGVEHVYLTDVIGMHLIDYPFTQAGFDAYEAYVEQFQAGMMQDIIPMDLYLASELATEYMARRAKKKKR